MLTHNTRTTAVDLHTTLKDRRKKTQEEADQKGMRTSVMKMRRVGQHHTYIGV